MAVLVVLGAGLALIGSVGLLRLPTFYERIHAPTLGTTMAVALTLIASMLLFSLTQARPVVHELVIAVFVIVTTPVTYMLLLRAAVHRDGLRGGSG
ncbi:MAG TPA: monovalent cation/H(+) antiporter subunit G [Casimicrobiaceae bacterium]|nr:monovalent cation/H(+) antiporter subunit G [Casimicrobiaceae bacterium]